MFTFIKKSKIAILNEEFPLFSQDEPQQSWDELMIQHEAARIAKIKHEEERQTKLKRTVRDGCGNREKIEFEAKVASATHPPLVLEAAWREREEQRCKNCQQIKTHRGEKQSNKKMMIGLSGSPIAQSVQ